MNEPTTTGREDSVTVLGGVWLTVGLFLDGYAHENVLTGDSESFVTVWHAVFYAGFAFTAWWLLRLRRRGPAPTPYRPAFVGLTLFGAGAVGDAAWHHAFGVETGIDALLSPTHLVLFVGLVLILATPLRSGASPVLTVVSVTLVTALAGFFTSWGWGFGIAELTGTTYDATTKAGEAQVIAGLASIALTTVVLAAAALVLARDRPPFGSFAVVFGTAALLVTAGFDEGWQGVPAALVGGLVLDAAVSRMSRPAALALSMFVAWSAYLSLVRADVDHNGWPVEIWTGGPVLASLLAAGIAWVASVASAGAPTGRPSPVPARRD